MCLLACFALSVVAHLLRQVATDLHQVSEGLEGVRGHLDEIADMIKRRLRPAAIRAVRRNDGAASPTVH